MLEYITTVNIGMEEQSVALFDANEKFITKTAFDEVQSLIKTHKLSTENSFAVVASIKDSNLIDIPFKNQLVRRLLLHEKFREMPVHYAETIQDTRLANAYFLFNLNKEKKLILDCHQFVFADIVDSNGLAGGYILPGAEHMKSIFRYNEYFKHYVSDEAMEMTMSEDIPSNNEDAIEAGILAHYYFSLKGIVKQHEPDSIYLTGSKAEAIANFLKPLCQKLNISLQLNKDLTHRSLCYIGKQVIR